MKLKAGIFNAIRVLAMIGSTIPFIGGLDYFYEIIAYGFANNWHFQNVSGWGFRFAFWMQIIVLGVILIVPFWLFVKTDAAVKIIPKKKQINFIFWIGLLFFSFAVVVEGQLQKFYP